MTSKNLKATLILFVSIILCPINLAAQQLQNAEGLSEEPKEWFTKQEWLCGSKASYDTSLDIKTFAEHYEKHPERWKKVFQFLSDNDLATLPLGKQYLDEDVILNIQEYITKEPGKELLEGHKKYIDLQFIVSGVELHGYAKLSDANETIKPYSEKEDIALYKVPVISYHVIKPDHFTIFFPDDIHLTNIQYGEKTPVRKIVFKVQVD